MMIPRPPSRRLRIYAFDPSFANKLDLASLNELILELPWEIDPASGEDLLKPGPVGEYLEVVDVDPASGFFYAPVDLDHPYLLAQDGHQPAVGNPQFHQQMVYAVAMVTIRTFERALGRCVLWAPPRDREDQFVRRLRIYPHALREANAYYSPDRGALLFGYFPTTAANPGQSLPEETIFTCLSHEIVVHETTHALLDGMQSRFLDATNPDVLAFHEALADLVALFQHFSFPRVVRHQIAQTRGDLEQQNLLAMLAVQFGQATGRQGALRDALGEIGKDGRWKPREPDPKRLLKVTEPHQRGAILVAAVFEAFLAIYKSRIADLLRIATGGTGVLPPGDIHPDLVDRLAGEASKTASHVQRMCIRALDYCPPVDVTFGDYLRALITADYDLVPNDSRNYRIAMIEAFRRRGIYPEGVKSLAVENVRWQSPPPAEAKRLQAFLTMIRGDSGERVFRGLEPDWGLSADRQKIFDQVHGIKERLRAWLEEKRVAELETIDPIGKALGLEFGPQAPPTVKRSAATASDGARLPAFTVHSIRPARREGPDGETLVDLVLEITQGRRGYLDANVQRECDEAGNEEFPPEDFELPGGCTLIIDLARDQIRYCIGKSLTSRKRLDRQRRFHTSQPRAGAPQTYFRGVSRREPFALLHRSVEGPGDHSEDGE